MTTTDLATEIAVVVRQVAADLEIDDLPPLEDDLVLLDSGLDSIAWATVVTLLEERLGHDPFLASDEPVYPENWREFVALYEQADRSP